MKELLAYTQRLEAAILAANNAQTRGNLQTILQQRLEQYAKMVVQVRELQAATDAANLATLRSTAEKNAATSSAVLRGTGATLGGAASAAARVPGQAAAGLNSAIGGVVSAFASLANVSNTLGSAMAPFAQAVAAFDPGTAQRFALALQDLSASAGRLFLPVIDAATKFADVLNGVFTSLAPAILPVVELLSQTLKEYAQTYLAAVLPAVLAVLPVFKQLLEAVRPLIPVVGETAAQFAALVAEVIVAFQPLLAQVLPLVVSAMQAFHSVLQEVIANMRAAVTTLVHVISNLSAANIAEAARGRGPLALDRIGEVFAEARDAARSPALQGLPGAGERTSAARSASITSIEAIGATARTAAFGARNPAEITNNWLERLWRQGEERQRREAGRDPAEEARDASDRA